MFNVNVLLTTRCVVGTIYKSKLAWRTTWCHMLASWQRGDADAEAGYDEKKFVNSFNPVVRLKSLIIHRSLGSQLDNVQLDV
jgi:hypothetical protein